MESYFANRTYIILSYLILSYLILSYSYLILSSKYLYLMCELITYERSLSYGKLFCEPNIHSSSILLIFILFYFSLFYFIFVKLLNPTSHFRRPRQYLATTIFL